MSTVDMLKIQKLVQQKRFADIVFEIESTTSENNRSALLHNLLGVSRASQKGKIDRDVQYALDDFEKAFYKDNLGQVSELRNRLMEFVPTSINERIFDFSLDQSLGGKGYTLQR